MKKSVSVLSRRQVLQKVVFWKRQSWQKKAYHEGLEQFKEAAQAHASALQQEAEGELEFGLLLIHAETILCSAETIRDLSSTIIELVTAKK